MNIKLIRNIVAAGIVGELVFEIYAWFISPVLFGKTLEPANLVTATIKKIFSLEIPYELAFVIHSLVGSIGFGLFVYLVHRLVRVNYILSGFIAGVSLWFVAQGLLAPFIGRSFMMDFGSYTQSSFIGHVGMSIIISLMLKKLLAPKD